METIIIIVVGIIAIALIIKFLGGLIRIALTVAIFLAVAYLLYQFVLT